jgi:oxygen-independent coproporphyrinogen-3 oxidase
MKSALLDRLGDAVPRYTSYPTAPHFHSEVSGHTVGGWIGKLPDKDALSLYVHVPFCDKLCWFCACHTKQTLRYEPVASYLSALYAEIGMVGGVIGGRGIVKALHLGGGSPTLLKPVDLHKLMAKISSSFVVADEATISIEIDPNDMNPDKLDALAAIGVTRASLGIQDFDPRVQEATNREQSFTVTQAVVRGLRDRGIASINLDLLNGLPHQTCESVADTVAKALSLAPDRIALFGYAHVPWFKKHQSMIDEAWLPGPEQRLAQFRIAAEAITQAGYVAVGIDHFARPGDTLEEAASSGRLRRNFQGYTDDECETLIGLGPSSVSRYRQGYAQNLTAVADYQREVLAGRLPIARGVALGEDDRVRGWAIERLMCDFGFSVSEIVKRFGAAARPVIAQAALLCTPGPSQMLDRNGDRFVIPADRLALTRIVASHFDTYFAAGAMRHSAAV